MNEKKKHVSVAKTIAAIVGIIVLIFVIYIGVGFYKSFHNFIATGAGKGGVEDYDKRIEIWNTVAGNKAESKLDNMNIDYSKSNVVLASISFVRGIVGTEYRDEEQSLDTFTYLYSIKGGYEKDTYEDEPYIIPYLVDGSDRAVIVVPGGGFGYKSMDGGTAEGKDIAVTLNENGISAFVLHWRCNPYEYPVPYLDFQRAVRYIRYHADDFHINPDKISAIGFSGGGNVIGTFINVIQGNDFFPEDYQSDEIDAVDDTMEAASMIYPALSFRFNVPMLFNMFDDELVRDPEKREECLKTCDLYRHISSQGTPQFIAYATKDSLVGMDETIKYIDTAKENGCDVEVVIAEGQDHGFAQKYYMDQYLKWLGEIK